MSRPRQRFLIVIAFAVAVFGLAAAAAPRASAKRYTDVSRKHWAYAHIDSVTDRIVSGRRLLDDYGTAFKPERAITRLQLARVLVLASGHYGDPVTKPVAVADVPPGARGYRIVQTALRLRLMGLRADRTFGRDRSVPAWQAEAAVVRWLKLRYGSYDWSLLITLKPSRWRPNTDWHTGAPSCLPFIVASRQLQLRINHPAADDAHEVTPSQAIDRAEVAYMIYRGYEAGGEYGLSGLSGFRRVTFPPLSARQKQVASYALKYVGYPYVWGGEYPTRNSPYGYQASGGFDCSGFVFYVMKMHFRYPITVNERGAADMAARAKPRITRANLKGGDLIFFGPKGPRSTVASIYHAGLYLGNGWFIHSTGSSDGVTLASLNTSTYWKNAFAWGRRLLTRAELAL